ncbi:MAG: hypothetical protein E4G98_05065, partial [Promethearchaeota archaeon]
KFTPDLSPNLWKARVDYINSYIGLNLSAKEMIACLRKMRLDATILDKNTLEIQVPAYRDDIMHEVDLVEEVAMGYGYQNLTLKVNMEGFGKYHPILQTAQKVREIMIGMGCMEMVNNILNSNNDNTRFLLNMKKSETIILANPVSSEYDTVRQSLLVSLMKNVQFNRSEEKPFHLFEVGDVILFDKSHLTQSRQELHLGAVTHSDVSDYSEIKGILDHFLRTFGIMQDISFKPVENPSYIPGRAAEIYYKETKIGSVGEIHPEVILNFGLDYPTAGFEVNLMPFIQFEE